MFDAFKKKELNFPEGWEVPKEIELYNGRIMWRFFHILGLFLVFVDIIVGNIFTNGFQLPETFALVDIPAYFFRGWGILFFIFVFLVMFGASGNIIVGGIGVGIAVFLLDWITNFFERTQWYINLSTVFVDGPAENMANVVTYTIFFIGTILFHILFLMITLKRINKLYPAAEKAMEIGLAKIRNIKFQEQYEKEEKRKFEEFRRQEEKRRYEEYRRQEDETRRRYEQQKQQEKQRQYEEQRRATSKNEPNSGIDFFAGCNSKEDVERKYKKLASIYHPDTGFGDEETMKIINNQKEEALKKFA